MCRHSCQWVLSKEFKGSSVFLPFTGQAKQLGTSFKLGNKPSSYSSWIQDIQLFILLYLRQEKTALGGKPLYRTLPAHPQSAMTPLLWASPDNKRPTTKGWKSSMGKAEWRYEAVMQWDTSFPAGQSKPASHFVEADVFSTIIALVGTATCTLNLQHRQAKYSWNELILVTVVKSSGQR